MALTKVSRGLLSTGVSDSSDATAITIDSSENVGIGKDHTIFALIEGKVKFSTKASGKKFVSVYN